MPTIVISRVIYPKIAGRLIEMGINYTDETGNLYINEKTVYILITSKKVIAKNVPTKSRLFGEAGIFVENNGVEPMSPCMPYEMMKLGLYKDNKQ